MRDHTCKTGSVIPEEGERDRTCESWSNETAAARVGQAGPPSPWCARGRKWSGARVGRNRPPLRELVERTLRQVENAGTSRERVGRKIPQLREVERTSCQNHRRCGLRPLDCESCFNVRRVRRKERSTEGVDFFRQLQLWKWISLAFFIGKYPRFREPWIFPMTKAKIFCFRKTPSTMEASLMSHAREEMAHERGGDAHERGEVSRGSARDNLGRLQLQCRIASTIAVFNIGLYTSRR